MRTSRQAEKQAGSFKLQTNVPLLSRRKKKRFYEWKRSGLSAYISEDLV